MQPVVPKTEKVGMKSGIATFFRATPSLSGRIYKICTLLSTGFVENMRRTRAATLRNPLPGAVFRGVVRASHGAGR
jgi:hypothetical protein